MGTTQSNYSEKFQSLDKVIRLVKLIQISAEKIEKDYGIDDNLSLTLREIIIELGRILKSI